MGKTVVVKDTYVIKKRKYEEQKIDTLILEEPIEIFNEYAFYNNNIKILYLPKSVRIVGYAVFAGNPIERLIFYNNKIKFETANFYSTDEITVIDGDYNFLFDFLNSLTDPFFNFRGTNTLNIVNNKLSLIEKLRIKYLASKYPNIKINIVQDINLDEFLKQQTNIENIDNEINELLAKIYSMIDLLDNKTKQVIIDKVEFLINEYQTKLEKSKPQLNIENNPSLIIEDTSPKTLRNNLIFSLEMIIQNLNTKGKIIKLSEKINQYQQYLLDNKINIENDEVFLKIKDVVNMSKSISEDKYINKLRELFEKIKKSILDNLNDEYIINLTLGNFDIETYFKEELDKIYNEVMTLNSKLNPYLELLKALNGYENDISLAKELRELERIFSELIGKTKDELNSEYQQLREKYKNILAENILKIKNNQLYALSVSEIELSFRKELNYILKRLNKLVPLILKNQKIYHQLSIANDKEENENASIIDLIREIKKLSKNVFLSSKTKDTIIDKLSYIIIHWEHILLSEDTSEIVKSFSSEVDLTSENLILEVMILKDLYELKFSIEQYIADLQEYDKAISSAGTISVDNPKSEIESLKELKEKLQEGRYPSINKKYLKEDRKGLSLINIDPESSEYKELMKCLRSLY